MGIALVGDAVRGVELVAIGGGRDDPGVHRHGRVLPVAREITEEVPTPMPMAVPVTRKTTGKVKLMAARGMGPS